MPCLRSHSCALVIPLPTCVMIALSSRVPAGASLHSCMSPHGPDVPATNKALEADTSQPAKLGTDAMAFMFEVRDVPRVLTQALQLDSLDREYYRCWQGYRTGRPDKQAQANGMR